MIITQFLGLDLQPTASERPGTSTILDNLTVTPANAMARRGAVTIDQTMPAGASNPLSAGRALGVVVPPSAGVSGVLSSVLNAYVYRCTGTRMITRLEASALDPSGAWVVLAATSDGIRELHRFPTFNSGVVSSVSLPFSPGPGMAAIDGRLWLADLGLGFLRASKIGDWTQWRDDGATVDNYLNASAYSSGGQLLGVFPWGARLVAIFADQLQVWRMQADLTACYLEGIIPAPGAAVTGMAVVGKDLLYLGSFGLRSLTRDLQRGAEVVEDTFGARVDPLVRAWTRSEVQATESPARGLGLWARTPLNGNTEVLVAANTRAGVAFSRWVFVEKLTGLVEWSGGLWAINSSGRLVRLDGAGDQDETGAATPATMQPIPVRSKHTPLYLGTLSPKRFTELRGVITGDAVASLEVDRRPGFAMAMPGAAPEPTRVMLTCTGSAVAISISAVQARADWRIDALEIHARG